MSKLLFDEDDTSNDNDFMLALQMQMQIDDDDEIVEEKNQKPLKKISMPQTISSLGDPELDLIDPCPDIRAMFVEFDKLYFWSRLGSCLVEWSKRMTICAGIFYLRSGGVIRLSEPLLKFRPRKDLVETLLHEMIHAYLYLTRNFKDRGDHGDEFKSHMNRINSAARTNISVYHSFHDEVNFQRQHVWRCNGVCRSFAPFYGYVRRSMNRAPSKNDTWWSQHQSSCNGTFEKVAEPESYKQKLASSKKSIKEEASKSSTLTSQQNASLNNKTLDTFFNFSKKPSVTPLETNQIKHSISTPKLKTISSNNSKKSNNNVQTLDKFLSPKKIDPDSIKTDSDSLVIDDDSHYFLKNSTAGKKIVKPEVIQLDDDDDDDVIEEIPVKLATNKNEKFVECPVCFKNVCSSLINSHVNSHFQ